MPLANWVKETTSTVGTGTITLVAEADQTEFSDAFADTTVVDYVILDDNGNKEEGRGTIGAGKTLARTTVTATLVSGTYDDTTAVAITLSGSATVIFDLGQASSFDKYDTEFSGSLWKTGAVAVDDTTNSHVNFGDGNTIGSVGRNTSNSSILGGNGNFVDNANAGVVVGAGNTTTGGFSCVVAGENNSINGFAVRTFIGAGSSNTITGHTSCIVGGAGHSAAGANAFIGGGSGNNCVGSYSSVPGGFNNRAQHQCSVVLGAGGYSRGDMDVIVGGVFNVPAAVANNTIRLQGVGGNILMDGAVSSPEAGIGECVEWADGNPLAEDRTGLGVSIVKGKLIVGGKKIVGVISQTCSLISNSAPNNWVGMYLRDSLKRKIYDEYALVEWGNEEGLSERVYVDTKGAVYEEYKHPTALQGVLSTKTPPVDAKRTITKVRRPNPDIDITRVDSYLPRNLRPEWGVVEVKGQPWCLIAEPVTSDYVKFNQAGKLINATELDGYPVMQTSDGVAQIWFID